MNTEEIGIILNGVTGRMGTNQHLERSITAIIREGGVRIGDGRVMVPRPLLTGRNKDKLRALAEKYGREVTGEPFAWTTDLEGALAGRHGAHRIFFDASSTLQRARFLEMAARAGLAVYCEKPTATATDEALRIAAFCEEAGVKNGVVQDKLWLPGMRKLRMLRDTGFFGDILSVRGEFGYWVFSGLDIDQPMQRPSWNYRAEEGGGIMIDMFCHWQYVIEQLFGAIDRFTAFGRTDLRQRRGEEGQPFSCTADDSAYAIFVLKNGVVCQFNSSWCTRVRRDDLLTIQVDGTLGSAVAGLREVWVQSQATTPKPVWNPDIPQPIRFYDNWELMPDNIPYDNAFKIQWEQFIRHVAADEPWPYNLREGARGVQLAELGMQSWKEEKWITLPDLETR